MYYAPKHTKKEFPALIRQLKSSDPEKQSRAASALGEIGDPRAVKPLVALLSNPEHWNGHYIAEGVVNGYIEIALESLGRPAVPPLQVLLKQSKDPRVRAATVRVLAGIPDPGRFLTLLDALSDPSPLVRWRVAYGFSATKSPRAVEPLINLLKTDADPKVRQYAALSLGWLNDRRAIEPLVAAIADKDEKTRLGVTQALQNYDVRDWTPQIVAFLKNPDPKIRGSALTALARIKDPRIIEPLIEELGDPDSNNRGDAVSLLGYRGDSRALPGIVAALKDPDDHVEYEAADALGRIGGPQAVDALLAVLDQGYYRHLVIPALARTGDPRAVEPLIAALATIGLLEDAVPALAESDDPRAAAALLKALREKNYDVIACAHRFYIIHTPPGWEDALLEALRRTQYPMEQDLLASGSKRLADAAWASLRQSAQEQRERPWSELP